MLKLKLHNFVEKNAVENRYKLSSIIKKNNKKFQKNEEKFYCLFNFTKYHFLKLSLFFFFKCCFFKGY